MITTVSGYPEAEMGEKDLSPQQSLLTHSYDEEEFDIPQVITMSGGYKSRGGHRKWASSIYPILCSSLQKRTK
jgi:hypothetical protein